MYNLLRSILFIFPAEAVHHLSMQCLKGLCAWGPTRRLVEWACKPEEHDKLRRELFGLRFPNPVGLGAGFDKNALYLRELAALGFGFVEIGTVTPLAQDGNPKPRLFRLPQDQGLINRMGFNNDGAVAIAERLRRWHARPTGPLIIGGNIGKNKVTPNEEAWKDYETCFRVLYPYVDYFVVNVSSPNTPGLRELQDKASLRRILANLQRVNADLARDLPQRPLLLKIAPDLNQQQL
ncbi:MAG TPA: quinone-dependent dihydroorotate dehydrogenase, partial [Puia sp.]|nr:quinone-dependent dihydroorotate dehydrogenase [Puia sp.]